MKVFLISFLFLGISLNGYATQSISGRFVLPAKIPQTLEETVYSSSFFTNPPYLESTKDNMVTDENLDSVGVPYILDETPSDEMILKNTPRLFGIVDRSVSDGPMSRIPQRMCRVGDKVDTLATYEALPEVEGMIEVLRENAKKCIRHKSSYNKKYCSPGSDSKPSNQSTGFCYRYVKYGLMGGGLSDHYLGGSAAKNAGEHLEKIGMENILGEAPFIVTNAETAPVGAVLVYEGGKYGHIEVKAGPDEFISDFVSDKPIDEYLSRKLIGVYIKEGEI